MKGDFTRLTFDPEKHYRAVLKQQGRVQLDSDWNEQVQIAEHRYSTFFSDFVGQSGAPAGNAMMIKQHQALHIGPNTCIIPEEIDGGWFGENATIELWYCPDQRPQPQTGFRCILCTSLGISFGIFENNRLCYRKWDGAEVEALNTEIEPGWHHLAFVFAHRKTENDLIILYSDGKPLIEILLKTPAVTIPLELPSFLVGSFVDINNTAHPMNDYFHGCLSDIRFWKTSLQPEQIANNLGHALLAPYTQQNLLAYYPLDDIEPSVTRDIVDHTPNGKDARIKGRSVDVCGGPFGLMLGGGRYYVDGLLVENENDKALVLEPTQGDGVYLAYLDVWTRHISVVEDPQLREPALGGPDTTTRIKTEWQVRLRQLDVANLEGVNLEDYGPGWAFQSSVGTGELEVRLDTAGGLNLDNRLNRVEIHQGKATPTFVWSGDNGATSARVILPANSRHLGTSIQLDETDRRVTDMFPVGSWIEVSDEQHALKLEPGWIASVKEIVGNQLTVEWDDEDAEKREWQEPVIVRRWEERPQAIASNWLTLGDSVIQVHFKQPTAQYRTGDYWLIPTRAGLGISGWTGEPQLPNGVHHHYAALGAVQIANGRVTDIKDLRVLFEPLTSEHVSISGDLCVRGKLGVGFQDTKFLRAPLSIQSTGEKLIDLQDGNGTSCWQIKRKTPEALSITDLGGKGLTIETGGNVGIGTQTPLYKLHVTALGGFNENERGDGTALAGNVPLVLQSDSTVLGFLNSDGRPTFALNLENNLKKADARGVPVFYDKYDGDWHSSICLKNGHVGIGTNEPDQKARLHSWGRIRSQYDPNDDESENIDSGIELVNRGPNGKPYAWTIYTAAIGGGLGVNPNSFEIWEYPSTYAVETASRPRLQILKSLEDRAPTAVIIDEYGKLVRKNLYNKIYYPELSLTSGLLEEDNKWEMLTGMQLTARFGNGPVLVSFKAGVHFHGDVSHYAQFKLSIDKPDDIIIDGAQSKYNFNHGEHMLDVSLVDVQDLSAGIHTFKVLWMGSKDHVKACMSQLIVIEL